MEEQENKNMSAVDIELDLEKDGNKITGGYLPQKDEVVAGRCLPLKDEAAVSNVSTMKKDGLSECEPTDFTYTLPFDTTVFEAPVTTQ